jgi:hypothetical protein
MIQTIINNAPVIITTILGIYEVIARAIPTVKDITIVGNIVKVLQSISDFLNVKKPA